jgi:O-antigen/teichoic acid export membrane protein
VSERAPAGRRALIGSGVVLAVAVGTANALNAVFQLALARILDPPEFSLVAALFTVVLIAAVPPLALQATVARQVATSLADGQPDEAGLVLRATLRSVLLWTFGLLVLTAIVLAPLAASLGLRRSVPFVATAATASIAVAIPVVWGGLQGAGRFGELSGAHVAYAGTRLGAGLAVALAGGGAGAVMVGVAGATAFTVLFSLVPLRSLLLVAPSVPARAWGLATRSNAAAALGLTTLTALTSTDLLVAKLAFSGHTAGAYAAASIGARVLLLLPVAVTTVLFPRVATLRDQARERTHLLAGLSAVAAVSALLVAVLWSLARPLLDVTFGSDYSTARHWLGPLTLAMSLYALATVYLYHFLSLGRARFALVLVFLLIAQMVAFAALHGRPADLVGVQVTAGAATLAASELWYLARHRAPPSAGEAEGPP